MRHIAAIVALQLVAVGPVGAEPTLFWFNDPVGPDDTVVVEGYGLDEITSASISSISTPLAGQTSASDVAVELLQKQKTSLKFVVPKELGSGLYRFSLKGPTGSISGRLNAPTVYWTQGSLGREVAPGGWLDVFGRNIVRRADHARLLMVADAPGPILTTLLLKGGLWRGSFRVPDAAPAGRYQLRLFNGDGADQDWTDAGTITVRSPDPDPGRSFDIRAYGANGDGRSDSTRAIRAALAAAADAGGGTVYLPRGRYLVSEMLVIPPGITLKGEATDLVNLVWPDFSAPPPALIQGQSHFAVEDVTIYASNHLHVVSGGFVFRDTIVPNAGDIAIRRVRIRASAFRGQQELETTIARMREFRQLFPGGGPDTIRLTGSRLEVVDCDILGTGNSIHLTSASDAVVARNILYNGRDGNYALRGSRRIIFEGNTVIGADLQATGGGMTTLTRSATGSANIFIGGNTFKFIHGWDREAATSDGPGGYYFGHAVSNTPSSLELQDDASPSGATADWTGALVMVVNGAGEGQHAHVASLQRGARGGTIALDEPLRQSLDATSEIAIVQGHENYLIVDNLFEDTGVAAQCFGTGLGHIIAGNRSNRTSGFAVVGLSYGQPQSCWRVQILDNEIDEGNVYRAGPDRDVFSNEAMIFIRANQTATAAGRPPLVRGIIIRDNRLRHDAQIRIEGFSPASPGIRDVVIEGNDIGPSRVGLTIDRGVAHWLARRNTVAPRIQK
ncbi:glycosyl hydrolase family 28-related protein [Bradyrhizobium sp. HKCCYLS3077]|uniref:glycosyl hydrolase family 28-related protein n=1 Tax=Bradyrhizobium sp. HKCCYLS3077 TaxID=3420761 RepID=UPI003EBA362D